MPSGAPGITPAKSASAIGVASGLMRTHSFCSWRSARDFRYSRTNPRAVAVFSAATESSRSRIRTSAPHAAAFVIFRSESPGTNSEDRSISEFLAGGSGFDEGAAAGFERPESILRLQRADDLVIVPGVLGFGRCLDLRQKHRADQPAVLAQDGTRCIEIIDRRRLHLRH